MQLSCFRDGFPGETVQAIVDISDFQDASFVMDVIEGLLDRSLLIILREGPRFSMLRSIFDFAAQKLESSGTKEAVFLRHVRRYGQWSTRLAEFYRHRGDELLAQLYEESANVRIAYQRAVEMNWIEQIPALALTLAYITRMHGPIEEGVTILETALAYDMSPRDKLDLKISWFKTVIAQRNWQDVLQDIQRCYQDFDEVLTNRDVVNFSLQKPSICLDQSH